MRTRTQTTTPKVQEAENPKKPRKIITIPSEYFNDKRAAHKAGVRLPGYNDIRGCLDNAERETKALNLSSDAKREEQFNLAFAKHMVGVCLTQSDDYTKPFFSMAGDEAGIIIHPGSIAKLYNEVHSMYQTVPELRTPLEDAGIDRLMFLFKSLQEDNPLKKRLRIGFSFLLEMLSLRGV